jgi:serine/threonine-protein kinase
VPAESWIRQRRTLAAAAGAALLLIAGVLAAVVWAGEDGEPESVGDTVEVATVPAVAGLRAARAENVLRAAGLAAAVERRGSRAPAGTVLQTKPKEGSRVERGAAILLIVSNGRRPSQGGTTTAETETPPPTETGTETGTETATEPPPTVTEHPSDTVVVQPEPELSEVPGVMNVGFVDSARMVEDRGYVAETYPVASGRPRGLVVRQEPKPGTPLARGRTVKLYVAVGKGSRGSLELGDFSGFPERQARELLMRAGFTVRVVDRPAPSRRLVGRVLRQAPGAPKQLPVLSQVVLYVGR